MRHAHSRPSTWTRATVRAVTVVAVALMAAGSMLLVFERAAAAATPTFSGPATIADGSTDTTELSGGSASLFTFNLPAAAACPGDTTTGGYRVDSYLVPQSTALTSLTFTGGVPSAGFALYNSANNKAYLAQNTDTGTGQISGLPATFEFGSASQVGHSRPSLTSLLAGTGVWEAGIACDLNGALTDYWNTEVTFTTSTSDGGGFVWTQAPGNQTTPTTTTTTTVPASTTTTTTVPASTTTTTTVPASTTTTTTTVPASTTTTSTDPASTTTTEPTSTTTTDPSGTTTTTDPSATTTTTDPSGTTTTTSTTSPSSSTTSTTGSSSTTSTVTGVASAASGGTGTGSSGSGSTFSSGNAGTGATTTGSTGAGTLAFTGFPVGKGIGLGLLAVGLGLVLLAWEPKIRARLTTAYRDGPQ